jgi:hypothetical protein
VAPPRRAFWEPLRRAGATARKHERHDEFSEWIGDEFNPDAVEADWLTEEVAALAKRWSRKPATQRRRTAGEPRHSPDGYERKEFPEPLFIAFNTAVTAWHITDWLWESRESTRALMKRRFNFDYNEWSLPTEHTISASSRTTPIDEGARALFLLNVFRRATACELALGGVCKPYHHGPWDYDWRYR